MSVASNSPAYTVDGIYDFGSMLGGGKSAFPCAWLCSQNESRTFHVTAVRNNFKLLGSVLEFTRVPYGQIGHQRGCYVSK
jgi:hypothetical protein